MRSLWAMIAHNNGTIWNASTYSRSLGVSVPTIKSYVELLEAGFVVRLLPAWYVNAEKRLIKSPKIYLRDTGLLHRMCRISRFDDLFNHPVIGGSWEGYVVEQVHQHKSRDLDMYYYRTQNGAECDIVLVRGIVPVACIEIKINNSPHITEGYFNCIKDLKTR
jgi:predicted AAA+ superfamily ATPase